MDADQKASLLVLHVDPYVHWLETGEGLEISRRRLKDITETLVLLADKHRDDPSQARAWLYLPERNMNSRIPAAVLRVGNIGEVRDQVEAMLRFS